MSDIHCSYEALEALLERVSGLPLDLITVTGDVECNEELIDILTKLGPSLVYVSGNMDDVGLVKKFDERGLSVNTKLVELKGYVVCGIGALGFRASLEALSRKLREYAGSLEGRLIVLSHFPPRAEKIDLALGRIHAGSKELRHFIEEFEPVVSMHGHIHEAPGSEFIGKTLAVNAGPLRYGYYALIDVEKRSAEILRLWERI